MPKFSVVISVFNKEKYITATLQSVLGQTFQDFEIVILNDGSTDNSEAEILKFTDSRISYFSEENKGAAAGRNYVIEKAKGEFVALLDADDLWDVDYLARQSELINLYPEESIFATALKVYENDSYRSRDYTISLNKGEIKVFNYFRASMLESILHSSSTVIRKNSFDVIGYYNPSIKSGQDTDLYVRVGLNYPIVFLNEELVTYNNMAIESLFKTSKSVRDKPSFEGYVDEEKENLELKRFLDLNRFSLCMLAKIEGDKISFKRFYNAIDLKNLNRKQRFLLQQNKGTLQLLLKTKQSLKQLGLRLSVFR